MNRAHLVNLDILRGVAALFVVLAHGATRELWHVPFLGQIGVAYFFSLSGFLMGYLYLGKKFEFDVVVKYVISRVGRIAPAYLTVVLVCYVIYNQFDPNFVFPIDNDNLLRHLLFSGNVHVFWTIPPEVQFYAFFLLIWFSVAKLVSRSWVPMALVLSLCSLLMVFGKHFPGTTVPYTLHFFLFGCMAGVIRQHNVFEHFQVKRLLIVVFFLFTTGVGLYLLQNGKVDIRPFFSNIAFSIQCSLMILICSFNAQLLPNQWLNGLFVAIGKCSFTLYLIHDIILYVYESMHFGFNSILNLLLCFILCISISYSFYVIYEKPLNGKLKVFLNQILKLKKVGYV